MSILFLFLITREVFSDFKSIHQIEYEKYIHLANFTPVSRKKISVEPLLPRITGMLKNYYGYLPYWVDTVYYDYFQMELLTHIAYFAVSIDPLNGSLGGIPNQDRFLNILNYSHKRGVRIHMTFIIFGSSNVSSFLNSPSARANAIVNIKDFISNYNIEGANIDFEFVPISVRDSFNRFINDLAFKLWNHHDGRKEIYLATPAVPEWYEGYDIAYLSLHSDGLFIMAYDFHWSGSNIAGPVSPAIPSSFWGQYSCAKTIGSYKNYGAEPSKMLLGIPYYGYDWPTVSENIGSETTGLGEAVIFYYAKQNANNYGRLWDSYSLTPWYRYLTSSWHQAWYDDSVSLDIKFNMVNDSMIQGSGAWALGYDRSEDDLWNIIRENFWVEPPLRHFTVQVNISEINIMDGPGPEFNILTTANLNSKFVAFDVGPFPLPSNYYWYKIYFPSAQGPYYAWIWGGDGISFQNLKGRTGEKILRVQANLLNVREGPSTSYPVITQIAKGQVFVSDSFFAQWARIDLPVIQGWTKGWINTDWTEVIDSSENHNTYNSIINEVMYPQEVLSGDTFVVNLKVKNTGWGPFDTLIYLKTDNPSSFYEPFFWVDSLRAKTDGFQGLPNQEFYVYSVFKAPLVSDTQVITENFVFERNATPFGNPIVISVSVIPLSISEKEFSLSLYKLKRNISNKAFEIVFEKGNSFEIVLFDIRGRKILSKNFKGKRLLFGQELNSGIYILEIRDNNGKLKREKLIKLSSRVK